MSNFLTTGKKALSVGVAVSTIAWAMGLAAFLPSALAATTLTDGDLIKSSAASDVYYYINGMRAPFPNEKVFKTWYSDFSGVKTLTPTEIANISLGGFNVSYRPGTKLVKITTDPKVYAVEPGGKLRWVTSEAVAKDIYGENWNKMIDDVADVFFTNYTKSSDIITAIPPVGTLIKTASSADVYYVDTDGKRKVADFATFTANKFMTQYIRTVSDTVSFSVAAAPGSRSMISGMEASIALFMAPSSTPTPTPTPTPTGTGLTLALDAGATPSTSVIADSTNGGQAQVNMAKLNFTAGTDGDVQVNTLKFKRMGIANDSDINNAYLYDGATRLAEVQSISSGVLTFTSAAGLFTVAKGTTKSVWVKIDVSKSATSGKTIGLTINAASDVMTSNASAVISGSFPMNGNLMSVATVTDLGKLTVANVLPTATGTVDAQDNYEVWKFSLQATNQNLRVSYLAFTNVGSTSATDIMNFKLYDGGTQLGTAVASMDANKRIAFDLSATPLDITSGVTKQLSLRADIKAGATRTYQFSLQKPSDIVVMDRQYNVSIFPFPTGGTVGVWTVIQAGGATTVNAGTLSISRTPTSRSGNIALNGTSMELGTFEFKAAGEDVKVSTLNVRGIVGAAGSGKTLKNVKIVINSAATGTTGDVQVGTTQTTLTSSAVQGSTSATADTNDLAFTLGNSLVVKAGTSTYVKVVADLTGTAVAADVVTVSLVAQTGNAQGQLSLSSVSAPASTTAGNGLTVAAGTLTAALNSGVASMTVVKGSTNQLVGSLILTAGSAEGIDLNSITITDSTGTAGESLGTALNNVKLMSGTTQLGTTQVNPGTTAGSTLTFSISPALTIPSSGSVQIDVRADILSGASITGSDGVVRMSAASGVGKSTTTTVSLSSAANAQTFTTANGGTVTISVDSSTPQDQIVVMNTTQNTLGSWRLSANNAEDLRVEQLILVDNSTDATGVSNVSNLKLYADGAQVGNTVAGLSLIASGTSAAAGVASATTFDLNTTATSFVGYYVVATDSTKTNGGKVGRITSAVGNVVTFTPVGAAWTTDAQAQTFKVVSGAVFSGIAKTVTSNGFKIFTVKADVPSNSNAQVAKKNRFILGTLNTAATGAGTDTVIVTGASSGQYATLSVGTTPTTYQLNNSIAQRTNLRATLNSASPSGTGKTRQANDIPLKFDLAASSANRALFRGGLQDAAESNTPSSGTLAGTWTASGATLNAVSATKVEGAAAISTTFTNTQNDRVANVLTTAVNLTGYTGVSFWIRSNGAEAAGDFRFGVAEAVAGLTNAGQVTGNNCAVPALSANEWKYVTCTFAGADAAVRDTVTHYGIWEDVATGTPTILLDDIRFFKDKMSVNVSGSNLLAITATPILMTLKNANTGATVATSYFVTSTTTTNGTATFIPVANTTSGTTTGDFEVPANSTVTVNLVVDSTALFTAAGSLAMNMSLGSSSSTVSSGSDFFWYDDFVNVTTGLPQVGLYGTSATGGAVGTIPWVSAGSDANPLQGNSLTYN